MSKNTLILEQIQNGELDSNQYTGDNLFQKLGEIQLSNEEILKAYPVEKMKALVEEKLSKATKKKSFGEKYDFRKYMNIQKVVGIAAVLCFALVLPFLVSRGQNVQQTGLALERGDYQDVKERAKGSSNLFIYKKTGDSATRLKNKSKVAEGDDIEMTYVASGAKYGFLLSVDGNGYLTQHYPEFGVEAAELDNSGEVSLGFSYRLDDAPDFERFIFITSDEQFYISDLIDGINKIINPEYCKTVDVTKFFPENVKIKEVLLLK